MSTIAKKILLILTCLITGGLLIHQYMLPISNDELAIFFKGDVITDLAFVFITIYLFYYVFREISKDHHELGPVIQSVIVFFLAILMLMHLVTPFSNELLKFYLSFRMIAVMVLIIIAEKFIREKENLDHYLLIFITLILMLVIVFMLDAKYFPVLLSLFYALAIGYMSVLSYKNKVTNKEPLKAFIFILIIFALCYDMFLLTFAIDNIELAFVVPALGIIVIYTNRMIQRIIKHNRMLTEKAELLKENTQLKKEYQRSVDSVGLIKNELSYKFMRKQHYFENLEIAIEVLQGSILIIDKEFKVAFAHGDLVSDSEYEDLVGMDVSKAIFDLSSDEGQYFKSVVIKIFKAVDDVREQLYISLLDNQLNINGRLYDMQYNVVQKRNGEKVLILHADMVSEYTQEGVMFAREKEISQMVITVAKHGEVFFSDLSTYIYFSKHLDEQLDVDGTMHDKIYKYLKRLHTFKGVFDQYNMQATVNGLNDVENELLNMLHHIDDITDEGLLRTLKHYDLENLVKSDLGIIKEKLGEMYLENSKKISIDIVKYSRLLVMLKDVIGPNHELVSAFRHLVFVDIKDILMGYKAYVLRLAKNQGKIIEFNVSGDSVNVRRETYIHFFESLIHLFKNSVIHGIEYPDERRNMRKSEMGTILCHIQNLDNTIVLTISDDGKGVDIKEMKNRLFISGKYTMDQLDDLSDEYICNLILEDGVSTSEQTGSYSGRGVGMSCIKEVVEQLEGTTTVHSQSGQGVAYELRMPMEVKSRVKVLDVMTVQKAFTLEAEKILTKNENKTQISNNWDISPSKYDMDIMLEATAHLTIQGVRDTHVCVSADERMLKHLVDHFALYGKYKRMSLRTMNEALSLFAEMLATRTVDVLQGPRQSIEITNPTLITERMFEKMYLDREGAVSKIDIGEGQLTLMVLSAKVRKGD